MNCPRCNSVAAFGQTTCQTCGASLVGLPETAYAVPSGYPPATTMPGYPMPLSAAPTSVGGELSTATAIVFALVAVCQLLVAGTRIVDMTYAPLALLSSVLQIAIIPLFLVWFFMARKNAGLWGTHRYKQGWSIGAWFVPIIFLVPDPDRRGHLAGVVAVERGRPPYAAGHDRVVDLLAAGLVHRLPVDRNHHGQWRFHDGQSHRRHIPGLHVAEQFVHRGGGDPCRADGPSDRPHAGDQTRRLILGAG